MSNSLSFLSKHKKYGYLIGVVCVALLPLPIYYWGDNTQYSTLRAWFAPFFVFVLIPIADHFVGEDTSNYSEQEMLSLAESKYYRYITYLPLPIYTLLLIWGMHALINWEGLSAFGKIGWYISLGSYGGAIGITIAHELIHKNNRTEQTIGGTLLALVCYAGFKIEHIYGHHVHVSTPKDASSAQYNQSLYRFLPNAYWHNFINAWKLQKTRLKKRKIPFFSLQNELLNFYALSISIAIAFYIWQGWEGVQYFLATSFVSFTLLEIVNYIEHYGLHREQKENGRYERVQPQHSWNSNHLVTNIFLFHLQRHSDHHAYPIRRYQVLRNFDDIPQLPSGYALMIVLALIPPLWKKIMNPRVEHYYAGRMNVLQHRTN